MKRKLLSLLVLLMTAATGAWAQGDGTPENPWISGDCTVTLSGGTLTISGTGAMADYTAADGQPWYSSQSSITRVEVGAGVTHIGKNSLRGFTNMTKVTLNEGLLSIGERAFQADMHIGFTEVNIPASVTSIGAGAFSGCKYLATVTFSAGSNLTGIGDNAFNGCSALSTIEIPAGVTSIGLQTFYTCNALTSIEIPASVTSIGNKAFFNCSSLTSITLNSNPYLGGTSVYTGGAIVTMNLTANSAGGSNWMTFYNERYNFVADENTQVFKAELSGTSIILHEVTDKIVTKAKAVILKSTGNPVMTKTDDSSSNEDANSLRGVVSSEGTTAPTPSTFYVLNYTAANGVGFYKLAGGNTLEAYKAYLLYDGGGAGARAFIGFDEATGIEGVSVNENFENGEVYDLQGRRVAQPTKGLYIVNGKKVFINK